MNEDDLTSSEPKTTSEISSDSIKETINFNKNDLIVIPELIENTIITDIQMKPAIEIFGDKAKNKDQVVLVLFFYNEKYDIKGNDVMTYYEKANIPIRSKLGKFIERYGELNKNTIITLERGRDSDFYKIRI
jgi:hypothetical protein